MLPLLLTLGVVITAQPLVDEDVLEPSVENEVDHALSRVPTNVVFAAASNLTVRARALDLRALGLTNALSRTQLAIRLVSSQNGEGRWLSGTNDVTREAAELLRWCAP